MFNVVEFCAEEEDRAGQCLPCEWGNLIEGHAVYCHNDKWAAGPRKCRRTWYTRGRVRDEDCPGFSPNLNPENVRDFTKL